MQNSSTFQFPHIIFIYVNSEFWAPTVTKFNRDVGMSEWLIKKKWDSYLQHSVR